MLAVRGQREGSNPPWLAGCHDINPHPCEEGGEGSRYRQSYVSIIMKTDYVLEFELCKNKWLAGTILFATAFALLHTPFLVCINCVGLHRTPTISCTITKMLV